MEKLVHEFHAHRTQQYSHICEKSRNIMDFDTPKPLGMKIFNKIDPSFYTSTLLGIPNSFFSCLAMNRNKWFMFGHFGLEDRRVEAMSCAYLFNRTHLTFSGVSYDDSKIRPNVGFSLQHDGKVHASEVIWASENHLVGLEYMYHRYGNVDVSLGGEIYGTLKELSGGVSFGGRLVQKDDKGAIHTTATINPIMGHIASTWTADIIPKLKASLRMDLNFYSFESDLTLGFSYTGNDTMQFKISSDQGLQAVFSRIFGRLQASVGFSVSHSGYGFGIELLGQ